MFGFGEISRGRFQWIGALVIMCFSRSLLGQADLAEVCRSIEKEYQKQMADNKIVGGALLAAGRGKVIVGSHYGWANEDKETAADEETVYAWGSITKTLTVLSACL
ncbi:MAG: hypothetical protein AMJ79_14760 [Phycisphaerae bacterium SM23_30]|nr:MAG: hypothetical protein AMJ79_14760 [Phycisphaerae bacterium SM23_30]